MAVQRLKMKILGPFLTIIIILSLLIALLGSYVIKTKIIDGAQTQVKNDLRFAWEVYRQQVRDIENVVRFTASRLSIKDAIISSDIDRLSNRLDEIIKEESLDILTLTDPSGKVIIRAHNHAAAGDSQAADTLVSRVISEHKTVSATEIIPCVELIKEGQSLADKAYMKCVPTDKAKPSTKTEEKAAMCIKAAAPVFDYDGKVIGIIYGGTLLNRNYSIVDKVQEVVYQGQKYKGKEVGTVTIFKDDLRISTNVPDANGNRAVGTRVSETVNDLVLGQGKPWVDRAYVVKDWYKSAYEPIKDINDNIIGMLYVGTLEQPFNDISRNILMVFIAIVAGVTLLAVVFSIALSNHISRPLTRILKATDEISAGNLDVVTETHSEVAELNILAEEFNDMAGKLKQREMNLKDLNKNYQDLIGFVSHELKGILASIVINVCSVRNGLLGETNHRQQKALEGAVRSLDYLTATVKKFLNLGKIEKGELEPKKAIIELKKDIFDIVINSVESTAARKNMTICNQIDSSLRIDADLDLMQVVVNNLLVNAIKYGRENGFIVLSSSGGNGMVQVETYNDSQPITEQEKGKLFQRFSRLDNQTTREVKGTGLGLFITKQIIEKHGGQIWVEPREKGNSFIFKIPI